MADDEHESLRRVHGYIATVSTVGQPRCDSLVGSLSFCEMAHETRRPNITNSDHPPNDVPRHRWRQFVGDCKNFLSSSENWANRATRLGWDAMALFGCAPKRPLDYLGSAGLVWAINGGRLLELHRDWAVIDLPVNRSQRIFYRQNVDAAKITLPWARRD